MLPENATVKNRCTQQAQQQRTCRSSRLWCGHKSWLLCTFSGLNATLGFVHCRERAHFPMDSSFAKDKKTQIGTFLSAEIKHVALSQLQNGLGLSARRPLAPRSSRRPRGGGGGRKKPRRDRQKLFHPRLPLHESLRTQRHAAVRVQGRRRRSDTLETEKLGDP